MPIRGILGENGRAKRVGDEQPGTTPLQHRGFGYASVWSDAEEIGLSGSLMLENDGFWILRILLLHKVNGAAHVLSINGGHGQHVDFRLAAIRGTRIEHTAGLVWIVVARRDDPIQASLVAFDVLEEIDSRRRLIGDSAGIGQKKAARSERRRGCESKRMLEQTNLFHKEQPPEFNVVEQQLRAPARIALLHGADYMPASFLVQIFPPGANALDVHIKKPADPDGSAGQIPVNQTDVKSSSADSIRASA
jgi:hypothetical protein